MLDASLRAFLALLGFSSADTKEIPDMYGCRYSLYEEKYAVRNKTKDDFSVRLIIKGLTSKRIVAAT